jgi:hypothetical protein
MSVGSSDMSGRLDVRTRDNPTHPRSITQWWQLLQHPQQRWTLQHVGKSDVFLRHHELLYVALSYIRSSLLWGLEWLGLAKRPDRSLQLDIDLAVEAFGA